MSLLLLPLVPPVAAAPTRDGPTAAGGTIAVTMLSAVTTMTGNDMIGPV